MANKHAKLFADREMRSEPASFKITGANAVAVVAGLVPAIHVFLEGAEKRRGRPEQARASRTKKLRHVFQVAMLSVARRMG
ncbi:MAG TPA: hypothetical protein VGH13_02495 [Xanthobacteraceae bacterium]|jgi:hypothetical protein